MSDKKVIKKIEHPLEDFFEVEKGSTEIEVYERNTEVAEVESYDEKDKEIEEQFQEVYDAAMDVHDNLAEEIQTVEGKYKARIGEVAIQSLSAALNAAKEKARLKEHKDKLEVSPSGDASSVNPKNQTMVITDRSAFLEQLRNMKKEGDTNEST
jgi:hypothetical protein